MGKKRQGTHKTKDRSDVSGGGKKPWRQKGRGTARSGTSRSPLWIGGGTIFGPKPRDYSQKVNKKVKKLAFCSAMSYKMKAEQILVVEDFNYDIPKTKEFKSMLDSLNLSGKKTLVLTSEHQPNVYKAGRNINKVNILAAKNASAYDILNSQVLVMQVGALDAIESILK